jgi:hypothetical protein
VWHIFESPAKTPRNPSILLVASSIPRRNQPRDPIPFDDGCAHEAVVKRVPA